VRHSFLGLLLLLAGNLSTLAQAPAVHAPGSSVQELAAFIGAYPAPDSEAGKADLAIVLWHQRIRTADDILRAASEVKLTLGAYSAAMGVPLDVARQPQTAALVEKAGRDIKAVTDSLKKHFARPRPYLMDARVEPAIERETSPSYPSGHATRGLVIAMVLGELNPGRKEALLTQGRRVGVNRVIGGVHYPSDIEAGQRLALRLAQAWLADPENQGLIQAARAAEWPPVSKP
jgi:acid phosphatase (class A)